MLTCKIPSSLPSMRPLICIHPEKTRFLLKFPLLNAQTRNPNSFLHQKCFFKPQKPISNSITASFSADSSSFCSGWDDLTTRVDSDELGESNQVKKFLILLGIDDKKYVFTCVLGFFCALAISRVRVSSLVIFPAAAVVFALGFSFGFVNGRPQKGLGSNGGKRRVKDETLRLHVEKLRNLVGLFDGFDAKVDELRDDIKKAIDHESVEVGDLEGYVDVVDSIGGLVSNARNVVEDCIGSVNEEQELGKNLIKNKGKNKKGIVENGFNLFDYMGGFLRDYAVGPKSSDRNVAKRASMGKSVDDRVQEKLRGGPVERELNSVPSKDDTELNMESSINVNGMRGFDEMDEDVKRILRRAKSNKMGRSMNARSFADASWYDYQNIKFRSTREVDLSRSSYREFRKWDSDESIVSSEPDFEFGDRNMEDGSPNYQHVLQNPTENVDYENYTASFAEETADIEDELRSKKYRSQQENNVGPFSSPTVSDDILFDKCLAKANELLKEAKQSLKERNDEIAEEMLHESASLLSLAITMKPMSLLAIGQLGNTYLLHGELKLRISRKLRRLLSKDTNVALTRKDRLGTVLVNVCEEGEALLVEAGRKYRTALEIDGSDLRALYNWGLALSFRAQLLADVGPEAALDADRLFLAAIDKFNAMMSKSNVYAPEALYRWGVALQQRSRLRPSNSRDKVKLLQQAKRLYEDALDMGSNNLRVREALSSCISELNFSDL